MGFCPQYLRTDCGTENGIIVGIQCFLLMSEDAHRYRTSISNQIIEYWWSHMRKGFTNWQTEFFKELVNENIFIPGNQTHLEYSWFVFSSLLQTELDEFRRYWNSHYIRQSRHDSVAGIPDVLFYLPEDSGYVNQKHDVTNTEIENILRERDVVAEGELETNRCDVELEECFSYVAQNEGLAHHPRCWREAKRNFEKILALCS